MSLRDTDTIAPSTGSIPILQRGGLCIDFKQHAITLDNHLLELSHTEFELLAYLAQAAPRVVSSTELTHQVQGYSSGTVEEANETLRYHIYRLRRKIKLAGGNPDYIQTVREVGYHLAAPLDSKPPSGIVTFLVCDTDAISDIAEHYSPELKTAHARYNAILLQAFKEHGGYVFRIVGAKFSTAFSNASAALVAAVAAQHALRDEKWVGVSQPRVRMALYTGSAEEQEGDYFGASLDVADRFLASAHGGQILLASNTQHIIADHLPNGVELRDFGSRRLRGAREPERVFQAVAPDLDANFPPLRSLDARPGNLPAQLTPFIGREAELSELGAELRRSDVRLLTLTGPGGTGKTRLGLQIASSFLDEYEQGVFFVPLATLRDSVRLESTIAKIVGAPEIPDSEPGQQLVAHLRERQLLLLLDNFEQLVEAAPLLNEVLRGAPRLKVIVTSREPLRIYGEHLYHVPPLPLPDLSTRLTISVLSRFAATTLFLQRAQAAASHWTLKERDAPIVAAICAKLDGLPLAIELAAARTHEFTLSELARHLTHRLEILDAGPRDMPKRQRTLRGMLDWSYEMLSPTARALFARLALFDGGFTSAAAQELVRDLPDTPENVTHELDSLAAKSLLNRTGPGSCRLIMLETIREYACELLNTSGEFDLLRKRHSAYYCELVEDAEEGLTRNRQRATLEELEAEHDNLRATLAWSIAAEDGKTALRISSILWRLWAVHSHLSEGRMWLKESLAHQPNADPARRAKALWGAGRLAMFQRDYGAAQEQFELCLTLYRQLADGDGIGWALNSIGELASTRGDSVRAQQFFEDGLALHRSSADRLGIAKGLDDLGGIALEQSDSARAAHLFEESLSLRRELGSTEGVALATFNLSKAQQMQGHSKRAEALIEASLELYRELDHPTGIATCLENLGKLKVQKRNFAQAAVCYTQALNQLRTKETEESELVEECLVGLAGALSGEGQAYKAAQVLGAAEFWLESLKIKPGAVERQQYEALRAQLYTHLGKEVWGRGMSQGQAMPLEDILEAVSPYAAEAM